MNTPIQTSGQPIPPIIPIPPTASPARTQKRKFRLFKRSDTGELAPESPGYKERPYYFRFSVRGVRYTRCLEVTDIETAQKIARAKCKEIWDCVVKGDLARLSGTRTRSAAVGTIKELLEAYATSPVDAEAATRRQNALALRQLLRSAICHLPSAIPTAPLPADPAGAELSLPITAIDGALARRWFELASTRSLAEPDQAQKATIKRTANSRYVQAKSVLAPKALHTYKDLGLYHPNFEAFLDAGNIFAFKKLPATSFNPPADSIIRATLEAWQSIDDRNLFLAIGHELAFGLRVAEWACARWSWWSTREGYPVLDGEIAADERIKNGTGLVQVRALDPWYSLMRERIRVKNWQEKPQDYIITGTPTNRLDGIPRAVSVWLRAIGWQTQKTNHELRKYAGSQIAMRYGIYDAQCWLRHSTVKVTEQHYSGYVRKFRPQNPDTIAARWATLDTTPQLRLLESA